MRVPECTPLHVLLKSIACVEVLRFCVGSATFGDNLLGHRTLSGKVGCVPYWRSFMQLGKHEMRILWVSDDGHRHCIKPEQRAFTMQSKVINTCHFCIILGLGCNLTAVGM
jgi:hypothetical protein